MSGPWPFDRRWPEEWQRSWAGAWSAFAAAAEAAGGSPAGFLPADQFSPIFELIRILLIGKKRTIRVQERDVALVLDDIAVGGTDLARSAGQYGEIRLSARDIEWDGYQLERLQIWARNVHIRPGSPPELVAAPVSWQVTVAASVASRWCAARVPMLGVAFDAGVPHVGLARSLPWLRLEFSAAAEGRSVWLRPTALRLGRRRLPVRLPGRHATLSWLPRDVVLTGIEPGVARVIVRGLLSEWHWSLSPDGIGKLVGGVRSGNRRAAP